MHTLATIISFLKKGVAYENGATIVLAIPGSFSLRELLNTVIADTPAKALVLPLMLAVACLLLYFLVFILDFLSGIKASRFEAADKNDFFRSSKGWSSIWKLSAVFLLVTWSSFFSMLAAIGNMNYLSGFFMLSAGGITIMATLLDIYSIGENQKRLSGKKSRIFTWLDEITSLINQGILARLKGFFETRK